MTSHVDAQVQARGFEKKQRKIGAVWLGLVLNGEDEEAAA